MNPFIIHEQTVTTTQRTVTTTHVFDLAYPKNGEVHVSNRYRIFLTSEGLIGLTSPARQPKLLKNGTFQLWGTTLQAIKALWFSWQCSEGRQFTEAELAEDSLYDVVKRDGCTGKSPEDYVRVLRSEKNKFKPRKRYKTSDAATTHGNSKPIALLSGKGGDIVKVYSCAAIAERELGLASSTASKSARLGCATQGHFFARLPETPLHAHEIAVHPPDEIRSAPDVVAFFGEHAKNVYYTTKSETSPKSIEHNFRARVFTAKGLLTPGALCTASPHSNFSAQQVKMSHVMYMLKTGVMPKNTERRVTDEILMDVDHVQSYTDTDLYCMEDGRKVYTNFAHTLELVTHDENVARDKAHRSGNGSYASFQ